MTGGLEGKIAVVTGAGREIGRAFALALGRAGCRIAAADVDLASAEATARLVQASEGEAAGLNVDVAWSESQETQLVRTGYQWH